MSKKNGKPGLWQEFKTFINKGNAMALAVGTIIGAAFSTITKSLTDDIIMPVINIFLGGADFSDIKIQLPRMPWVEPTYEKVVNEAGEEVVAAVTLNYGNFLQQTFDFLIIAFSIFLFISLIKRLTEKKKEEEPAPAPEPSNEEKLLTEIRDLLKNK